MSKRAIVVLAVLWIVLLVAGVSTSLTLMLCSVNDSDEISLGSAHIVSAEEYALIDRFSRLQEVLDILKQDYYQPLEEETLVQGAIDGMMLSLADPYSFYYTPEAMQETNERQSGTYHGVGLQLLANSDGLILITRAFRDGPAQTAGVQSGDIILEIDGIPVSAESTPEMNKAVEMLRREDGAVVLLTILRGDEQLEFEVTCGEVTTDRVEYRMLQNEIGYLALYEFMGNDVESFERAMEDLREEGMQALILDLRANPGGLLDDAIAIADMLLPEGLIVYTQDRAGQRESFYSDAEAFDLPLAVLIDGNSASASEILAGAIQDYGVGTLIGENTFGKGIVQTVLSFPQDGAGIQLTTSSYYTPLGRSIHGVGIEPDIQVLSEEGFDVSLSLLYPEEDAQLQSAVSYLLEEELN